MRSSTRRTLEERRIGQTHNIVHCSLESAWRSRKIWHDTLAPKSSWSFQWLGLHSVSPSSLLLHTRVPRSRAEMVSTVLRDESHLEANFSDVAASRKACSSMGVLVFTAYVFRWGSVGRRERSNDWTRVVTLPASWIATQVYENARVLSS